MPSAEKKLRRFMLCLWLSLFIIVLYLWQVAQLSGPFVIPGTEASLSGAFRWQSRQAAIVNWFTWVTTSIFSTAPWQFAQAIPLFTWALWLK
jgi:hypothetical protein